MWVPSTRSFYWDPEPSVSSLRSLEVEAVLDLTRFIGAGTVYEEVSGNNFFLVMSFHRTFD